MFNDSINFVAQSIEKSQLVDRNGCYYQSLQGVLPESLLCELVTLKTSSCTVVKLEKQEHRPRVRVDYSEAISKKLNIIFKSSKIKNVLEHKYKIKLYPQTTDIWFDFGGYNLIPHTDDPRLALSLQIYLDTQQDIPGTALYDSQISVTPFCVFKYVKNTGYSLLNNDRSWHGTEFAMNSHKIRKSIYIRYGTSPQ